jgi:hypothetical protein
MPFDVPAGDQHVSAMMLSAAGATGRRSGAPDDEQ